MDPRQKPSAWTPFAVCLASLAACGTPASSGMDAAVDATVVMDAAPDAEGCGWPALPRLEALVWDGESEPADVVWNARTDGRCAPTVQTPPWLEGVVSPTGVTFRFHTRTQPTGTWSSLVQVTSAGGGVSATARLRVWHAPASPTRRRALLIGIDGARPDALEVADAPVLHALERSAAWTHEATTQLTGPTKSAPGWLSILTAVEPAKHGVTANGEYAGRVASYVTFLARATRAGKRNWLFTAWPDITEFSEDGATQREQFMVDPVEAPAAARVLATEDVDALFIQFDQVDGAGHRSGFSATNPDYLRSLANVDGLVGQLLDGILSRPQIASEEWLVCLTTDHGGFGTNHGALDRDNRRIFVVVAGPSVRPEAFAADRTPAISHMDLAPTVLTHLGVTLDPAWGFDGRVVPWQRRP